MTTAVARTETTPAEAVVVIAICFGWAILLSLHSVAAGYPASGGFTDAGAISTVVVELVCAAISLAVLRYRRYDIASLWPRATWRDSAIGLGLFVAVCMTGLLLSSLLASPDVDEPIQKIMRASTITPAMAVPMSVVNGTFEEVFLLGFLQRGLQGRGLSISLGVTLLVRVLYHLYQGPTGAVMMLGFGGVLGLAYARIGRLWPAVFAHVLCDICALVS